MINKGICDMLQLWGPHHSPFPTFQMFDLNMNKFIYKHFSHPYLADFTKSRRLTRVRSPETKLHVACLMVRVRTNWYISGSLCPVSSSPAPCPHSGRVPRLHCKQTQSSCYCASGFFVSRKSCKAQGWERTCSRPSVTKCIVIPVIQLVSRLSPFTIRLLWIPDTTYGNELLIHLHEAKAIKYIIWGAGERREIHRKSVSFQHVETKTQRLCHRSWKKTSQNPTRDNVLPSPQRSSRVLRQCQAF